MNSMAGIIDSLACKLCYTVYAPLEAESFEFDENLMNFNQDTGRASLLDAIALKNNASAWILVTALLLVYLCFFVFEAHTKIQIQTDSDRYTFFKVYWAEGDQTYAEARMARVRINRDKRNYAFYIADLDDIDRLRIDPGEYAGKFQLSSLQISQSGYQPIELVEADRLSSIKPNKDLQLVQADPTQGLNIITTGNDGYFEIDLKPLKQGGLPWQHLTNLAVMLALLLLAMRLLQPLLLDYQFVPCLMGIGLVLAMVMAALTGLNVHPDEVVHLAAVEYYTQHWLPPALDSEGIANTYSIYGSSRLDRYEIYYQLAGYFQHLISGFRFSTLFGARLFGLVLFTLLLAYTAWRVPFRLFALPLIISAQIWYIFSYTNSDAFALCLTLFISYLAARPSSVLNHYLSVEQPDHFVLKTLGLGLMLGMLLLLKLNFYFYTLFIVLYLFWRIWRGDFPKQKRLWRRLGLLCIVALSVFGARYAMDLHVNGWDSAELQAQMQEQRAQFPYKASTPLAEQNPMLHLKDRGYSIGYIVSTGHWFEKTFNSAFGVYGFSWFRGSTRYFDLVRYTGLLLLGALLVALVRSRKKENYVLFMALSGASGALIAAGIWSSWALDFQAQGRYLLPTLPMLSIFYYHLRNNAIPQLIEWLTIVLFLFAVYSFISVGLGGMLSLGR